MTQFFTIEQHALREGLQLAQQRIDVPVRPKGDGWAGVILTVGRRGPLLDKGLVGEHRWTSESFEIDADSLRVGDFEVPLPLVEGTRAKFAVVRSYDIPLVQDRPPLVFVELVIGSCPDLVVGNPEQPAQHRALGFVALAGHGFSLAAPGPFNRYLAGLEDGNPMHRFTTFDDGEQLLAAGHFLPIWGVHQWDYRLVFCRGALPEADRPLLGRQVLPRATIRSIWALTGDSTC